MSSFPRLQNLAHSGRSFVHVKYCPVKTPWTFDLRNADHPLSPGIFRIRDMLERRDPNLLQWRIITHVSAKIVPHAVLRNRLKRRYASAFGKALQSQGYHDNGKPRKDAVGVNTSQLKPLQGTLEIYLHARNPLTDPFSLLVQDAAHIVHALKKRHDGHIHQKKDRIIAGSFSRSARSIPLEGWPK